MHIFIDANILVDLHGFDAGDLAQVDSFIPAAFRLGLTICTTTQLEDEYIRNGEQKIIKEVGVFSGAVTLPRSATVRKHPAWSEVTEALRALQRSLAVIEESVRQQIAGNDLPADRVVKKLFARYPPQQIDEEMFARAQRRKLLGNPPGKGTVLGDEVNWEWLLANVPPGNPLHIVSNDGDFASSADSRAPNGFLVREWAARKGGAELHLYKTLAVFLQKHFPDFRLPGEVLKQRAIDAVLRAAATSGWAGLLLEPLLDYDSYTEDQLVSLLEVMGNPHLHLIADDYLALGVARTLVGLAKSEREIAASHGVIRRVEFVEEVNRNPGVTANPEELEALLAKYGQLHC